VRVDGSWLIRPLSESSCMRQTNLATGVTSLATVHAGRSSQRVAEPSRGRRNGLLCVRAGGGKAMRRMTSSITGRAHTCRWATSLMPGIAQDRARSSSDHRGALAPRCQA
jgi:hypothetical protein